MKNALLFFVFSLTLLGKDVLAQAPPIIVSEEMDIVCESFPLEKKSVTFDAEAIGVVYGNSFTVLDEITYSHYYNNSESSAISGGANDDPLCWDFWDDSSAPHSALRYGFYQITGPDDVYFYLDLLHCTDVSPDVHVKCKYISGEYRYFYYDGGSWDEITGDILYVSDVVNETPSVSCLQVDISLENEFELNAGGTTNQYGSIHVDDVYTSHSSPASIKLDMESEYDFWPNNNIFASVEQDVVHRFKTWDGTGYNTSVFLDDHMAQQNDELVAKYAPANTATGRVRMDGVNTAGTINMRDPWKTTWIPSFPPSADDSFALYSIPSTGYDFGSATGYGGVFIDMTPALQSPYYVVMASENVDWNTSSWVHMTPTTTPSAGEANFRRFWSAPNSTDILGSSGILVG